MTRRAARVFSTAVAILVVGEVATARADGLACASAAESGEVLIAQKKLVDARTQLLVCAAEECPKVVRQDCLRWLDEVNASIPSIVVRVRDAHERDVLDSRVSVDGHAVEATGRAIPVDPGRHVIVASRGTHSGTEEILVAEGEKRRLLSIQIIDTSGGRPGQEREPTPATGGPGPWPWVLFTVAAGGFATFTVLQLTSRAKYDDLRDSCSPRCDPADVSGVRTQVLGSAVGLGVGVVSLAAGLVLWFGSKKAPPAQHTVDATPGGGRGASRVTF